MKTAAKLLALAVLMAAGSAEAQVKLRYAHVGVANAPQTLYADEVAKLVKERTAGRVEIQVFPNSQLGGVNEMVDGVRSGAIAIAHHDFGSLARIVPNTAVFNTPFMYRDPEHSMRATDPKLSPALREINNELVKKGSMRIVASLFQGTRHLTSKEKVLSVKDMQGKKYRGVPIKLWSSMLTGMGAVATPVEVSELATALATGLVVGQENPLPNIYNLKLYEVQKYVMLTGHMQSILSVFVNEGVYQKIPAADRRIMEHDDRGRQEDARLGRETFAVPQGARGEGHDFRRAQGRP
jgi:tripartite ATP-independent transporter DctP family solute receptor